MPFFHISGNLLFLREYLEIRIFGVFKGQISDWLQIFIILIDILLQPWALLGFSVFITANMTFSVVWKDLIQLPVLNGKEGKKLALSIGVHIKATKLPKMFALLQKSETNLPSTRRGDIVGSLLKSKRFNIVKHVQSGKLQVIYFIHFRPPK